MNSPAIPRASAMLVAAMLAIVPGGVASAIQGLPAGIVVYTVSTFPVSCPGLDGHHHGDPPGSSPRH